MRKLDKTQIAKKDALQTLRTVVRLKAQIKVREVLNELEPQVEEEIDEAVMQGKGYKANLRSIFDLADEAF